MSEPDRSDSELPARRDSEAPTRRDSEAPVARDSVIHVVERLTGATARVLLRSDTEPPTAELAPTSAADPQRKGAYRVIGEIARGGMGAVLRGHDPDLGRDVALKVLHEKYARDPAMLQRFVEEAQIGGQLQHPGIVPVYELGLLGDQRPYFTMKLVKGRTLASLLAEREAPADRREEFVGVFESVCQTIAYAHARGVIHRDLKPANVMVGSFGEVQVVDWGIAKVVAHRAEGEPPRAGVHDSSVIETVRSDTRIGTQSIVGSVMGTPEYMPPEQARGEIAALDERADVFALGAILCEILTGRPPYTGRDLVLQAARCELDHAHEALARCGADAGLRNIVARCLAPDPEDRPADAGEVAAAVREHRIALADRARAAELATAEARGRAAQERRARRLTAALAIAILCTAAIAVGAYLWRESDRNAHAARNHATILAVLQEATALRATRQPEAALAVAQTAVAIVREGPADAAHAERVAQLVADVEREAAAARTAAELERRNRRLLDRLEAVRAIEGNDTGSSSRWVRKDRRYAAAFLDRGLDVTGDRATIVAAIRTSGIAVDIATALDEWARALRRRDGAGSAPARGLLEIAIAVDPDPARVALRSAIAARDAERLRAIGSSVEVETWPPVTANVLATALADHGDRAAAIDLLTRVQRRCPDDFTVGFNLALWLWTDQPPRLELAARHLSAAHALRPTSVSALNSLGLVLRDLRDPDGAARSFDAAIAIDPSYVYAHVNRGLLRLDARDHAGAIAAFEAAIAIDPELADAHNKLGVARIGAGDVDGAIAAYRAALALAPDDPLAHSNLGVALERRQDFAAAADAYRAAIAIAPGYARAHNNLGVVLRRLGDLDAALVEFDTAIELAPQDSSAHANLGWALHAAGDATGALDAWRRATELDPRNAAAFHGLARGLEQAGDIAGTAAALARVVELRPNDADACNSLAWTLATTAVDAVRDAPRAVALALRAVELRGDVAAYWNTLGVARYRAGEIDAAIAALDRSIALGDGGDAGDWLPKALAHHARGEIAVARDWLARAERWFAEHSPADAALQRLFDEAVRSLR